LDGRPAGFKVQGSEKARLQEVLACAKAAEGAGTRGGESGARVPLTNEVRREGSPGWNEERRTRVGVTLAHRRINKCISIKGKGKKDGELKERQGRPFKTTIHWTRTRTISSAQTGEGTARTTHLGGKSVRKESQRDKNQHHDLDGRIRWEGFKPEGAKQAKGELGIGARKDKGGARREGKTEPTRCHSSKTFGKMNGARLGKGRRKYTDTKKNADMDKKRKKRKNLSISGQR